MKNSVPGNIQGNCLYLVNNKLNGSILKFNGYSSFHVFSGGFRIGQILPPFQLLYFNKNLSILYSVL